MTEERIGDLTGSHGNNALGPRTAAAIQELKAEGTRCFGGRAPRPINDEQGVQP